MVSDSADPTGSWTTYPLLTDPDTAAPPDLVMYSDTPFLGYSKDKIVVAGALFNNDFIVSGWYHSHVVSRVNQHLHYFALRPSRSADFALLQ